MHVIQGDDFALQLLDLETCTQSRMRVGRSLDEVYVWNARGQLVQAVLVVGGNATCVLTESSDGRPTLIAAETLDEHERMRPMHVRALDLLTGVVRWRRREKLHSKLECFMHRDRPVVRIEAPAGAHVFDVDTGKRLRVKISDLVELRMRSHKKPPAGLAVPPVELMPIYTTRRDLPSARGLAPEPARTAITAARRAYYFDSHAGPGPWAGAVSPLVTDLVEILSGLENKSGMPALATGTELPPDVQALVASDSAALESRWHIGPTHLARLGEQATRQGRHPWCERLVRRRTRRTTSRFACFARKQRPWATASASSTALAIWGRSRSRRCSARPAGICSSCVAWTVATPTWTARRWPRYCQHSLVDLEERGARRG